MNINSSFLYSRCGKFAFILILNLLILQSVVAQEKQTVKIKTFDEKLRSLKNIEVSLNHGEFVSVGKKGVAIVELNNADLPIKSVKVKDCFYPFTPRAG